VKGKVGEVRGFHLPSHDVLQDGSKKKGECKDIILQPYPDLNGFNEVKINFRIVLETLLFLPPN
jgi:hypothetical protein